MHYASAMPSRFMHVLHSNRCIRFYVVRDVVRHIRQIKKVAPPQCGFVVITVHFVSESIGTSLAKEMRERFLNCFNGEAES